MGNETGGDNPYTGEWDEDQHKKLWCCYDINISSTEVEISEEKMKEFEVKYKDVIDIFTSGLFSRNGKGIFGLFRDWGNNYNLNKTNIGDDSDGRPNLDKTLAMFFGNDSEVDGVNFSLGIGGFEDEFYADLLMLSEEMIDIEWDVTVTGAFQGFYKGSFCLTPKGLGGDFEYDSGVEDCSTCDGDGGEYNDDDEYVSCDNCEGVGFFIN